MNSSSMKFLLNPPVRMASSRGKERFAIVTEKIEFGSLGLARLGGISSGRNQRVILFGWSLGCGRTTPLMQAFQLFSLMIFMCVLTQVGAGTTSPILQSMTSPFASCSARSQHCLTVLSGKEKNLTRIGEPSIKL